MDRHAKIVACTWSPSLKLWSLWTIVPPHMTLPFLSVWDSLSTYVPWVGWWTWFAIALEQKLSPLYSPAYVRQLFNARSPVFEETHSEEWNLLPGYQTDTAGLRVQLALLLSPNALLPSLTCLSPCLGDFITWKSSFSLSGQLTLWFLCCDSMLVPVVFITSSVQITLSWR